MNNYTFKNTKTGQTTKVFNVKDKKEAYNLIAKEKKEDQAKKYDVNYKDNKWI